MLIVIDRVLLVREHWLSLILSGEKTWEMRRTNTTVRGWVGLSDPGSGLIKGVTCLDAVLPVQTPEQLVLNRDKHCVPPGSEFAHYNRPWVLSNQKKLTKPAHFVQKPGAVIWVRTNVTVEI